MPWFQTLGMWLWNCRLPPVGEKCFAAGWNFVCMFCCPFWFAALSLQLNGYWTFAVDPKNCSAWLLSVCVQHSFSWLHPVSAKFRLFWSQDPSFGKWSSNATRYFFLVSTFFDCTSTTTQIILFVILLWYNNMLHSVCVMPGNVYSAFHASPHVAEGFYINVWHGKPAMFCKIGRKSNTCSW